MEDRCIICGADVSDLSTQVCTNCVNKQFEHLKKIRENRRHLGSMRRIPDKWRMIPYLEWLRETFKTTE